MGMAYEQALGIVGRGGQRLLDLDYGILAAGDDEAVGVLGVRREEGERTEPLLTLGDDGGIERGWLLRGPAPKP